jgi:hypothetical protein
VEGAEQVDVLGGLWGRCGGGNTLTPSGHLLDIGDRFSTLHSFIPDSQYAYSNSSSGPCGHTHSLLAPNSTRSPALCPQSLSQHLAAKRAPEPAMGPLANVLDRRINWLFGAC